jgi:hypothetical protein
MRLLEDKVFRHERYSKDTDNDSYFARDFYHLCRGLKLVRYFKYARGLW